MEKSIIENLGETLRTTKEYFVMIDKIEYNLQLIIGQTVETIDGRMGFITYFDLEKGEVTVEFGLKNTTNYVIKFYSYKQLLNRELKFISI